MRKSKRIFSFAVAFSLVASLAVYAPTVFSDSSSSNEAFEYEINEDGESITITSYRGLGGSVKIPSDIDGKEVTGVGKAAFASCSQIEVLSIPVSVDKIDELAFSGCSKIKEISIPDEVIEIGKMAFANCTSLEIVNLGDKLQKVGDYAFMGCTSLNKMTLPDNTESIGQYAFYNCKSLEKLGELPNIKNIGGHAFENTAWINNYKDDYIILGDGMLISYCGKAENLTLQENIKTVGASAFLDNKTVKNLKTTKNTKSIQEGAFESSAIETADLSASGVSIADKAFSDCIKLKEVKFSDSTSKIGKNAFKNCNLLKSISLPKALKNVESNTFNLCSSLKNVNLGVGVTVIEENAFDSCISLGMIEIPENVSKIEDDAFDNCISLTRVVVKGGPKIGSAFKNCENLEEVAFYAGTVSINDDAFKDSKNLTIYSSSESSAEKFANEKHFEFKLLSDFEKKSYVYKGMLDVEEEENFSGGYTFIVILIIVVECIVAFSVSAYVLLKGPGKKSMRHVKKSDSRHSLK